MTMQLAFIESSPGRAVGRFGLTQADIVYIFPSIPSNGSPTMREAKLFMNGKSQAVRLPKAFRFSGTSVLVKRHGAGVLLLPIEHDPWQEMAESLTAFSPDLELVRDQGVQQRRPSVGAASRAPRAATRRRRRG
jgi:antitoxin VapB